jgi:hypothetical protein
MRRRCDKRWASRELAYYFSDGFSVYGIGDVGATMFVMYKGMVEREQQ